MPKGGPVQDFIANLNAVNDAWAVFLKVAHDYDVSGIDKAVEALDNAPHLDDETQAIRSDLKALLLRLKAHAEPLMKLNREQLKRQDIKRLATEKQKILNDFSSWQKRYEKWTDNESARLGVKLTREETPQQQQSPEPKEQKPGKGK